MTLVDGAVGCPTTTTFCVNGACGACMCKCACMCGNSISYMHCASYHHIRHVGVDSNNRRLCTFIDMICIMVTMIRPNSMEKLGSQRNFNDYNSNGGKTLNTIIQE